MTDVGAKPFVHPLVAPSGRVVTAVGPGRHPWHRGLWFAVKDVGGVNFWEEPDEPHGRQVQDGTTVRWVDPAGTVRLLEERHVGAVSDEETPDGATALDWTSVITAPAPVVLDRTPYTTWGGYGGLAVRGPLDWTDTTMTLDDGTRHRRPEGVPSRWCDLAGTDAGITILDHPTNPRSPVPWYGATRSRVYGDGWANFCNAALLFHAPLALAGGEALRLRYRVVVHGGTHGGWTPDRSEAAWAVFAR